MNDEELKMINGFVNEQADPQKAREVLAIVARMNFSAGYKAAVTCQQIVPVDPPKKAS